MAGSMMGRVARECETECGCGGGISASPFLGAGHQDEESEAFATALDLSHQQHQEEEEEVLADLPQQQEQEEQEDMVPMCTLPSPTRSPPRRKPRVCVRKVRVRGAKIRTPTPSPDLPPEQAEQQPHADPLYRAVQMVGALTGATARSSSSSNNNENENAVEDFLALARRRGLL